MNAFTRVLARELEALAAASMRFVRAGENAYGRQRGATHFGTRTSGIVWAPR